MLMMPDATLLYALRCRLSAYAAIYVTRIQRDAARWRAMQAVIGGTAAAMLCHAMPLPLLLMPLMLLLRHA